MKTKITLALALFVSAITLTSASYKTGNASQEQSALSSAQVENVFRSINVHRQERDGISINWTVSTDNINSYIIQRSYDGEYFEDLNLAITSVGRWNRTHDSEVFPGYIYYRIVAILEDGTESYSPVQVIRIVRRK